MDRSDTRVKFMLIVMLAALILSTTCFAGTKDQDPPKFFIRHQAVDVGEVYEGEDISYVYDVRNNGSSELHIINVRPG
ncbi:MAG TPA: hypothetical protein VMX58_12825 [Patescibacteria group bacterium]|nr:hypothetical protein [Patescibacteria group bacterium]